MDPRGHVVLDCYGLGAKWPFISPTPVVSGLILFFQLILCQAGWLLACGLSCAWTGDEHACDGKAAHT